MAAEQFDTRVFPNTIGVRFRTSAESRLNRIDQLAEIHLCRWVKVRIDQVDVFQDTTS
jgi:hypothetical protein